MITLNAYGENAIDIFAAANPQLKLHLHVTDIAWFDGDTLLVLAVHRHQLYLLSRADSFSVKAAVQLPLASLVPPDPGMGDDLLAIRAGGKSWIGQYYNSRTDKVQVVGELSEGRGPYPIEYSDALVADVAHDGSVLTARLTDTDAGSLEYLPAGAKTVQVIAASRLARPPRLSPDGKAITWLDRDALNQVQAMTGGVRYSLPLPGPALLTPRMVDFFDAWWVLSVSYETGITLTQAADPTVGYQWWPTRPIAHEDGGGEIGVPGEVTAIDAYLSDQVYVVWETEDGQVHTSDGLSPGMDLQTITRIEYVPPTLVGTISSIPEATVEPLSSEREIQMPPTNPDLSTFKFADIGFEPDAGDPRAMILTALMGMNDCSYNAGGATLLTAHSKVGQWTAYAVGPADGAGAPSLVESNQWFLVRVGDEWIAAANEWVRPGQNAKHIEPKQFTDPTDRIFYDQGRWPRLYNWFPAVGEVVGVFCTTPRRGGVNPEQPGQRSNVVFLQRLASGDMVPVYFEAASSVPPGQPPPPPQPVPVPTPTPTPTPTPMPAPGDPVSVQLDRIEQAIAHVKDQNDEILTNQVELIKALGNGFTGTVRLFGVTGTVEINPKG